MDQQAIVKLGLQLLPHIDKINGLVDGIQKAAKGDVGPLMKILQGLTPETRDEIMKLVLTAATKLGKPDMLKLIT